MFGKHFASMYTGSMMGAGAVPFAIMGYVIANLRPDPEVGAQVELNPRLLAAILGENEAVIETGLKFLCAPDANSRTKDRDGRRLIRVGQFDYQVVNGAKYAAIRNEDDRRRSNREAKRRERARKMGLPLPGEVAAVKAAERGDEQGYDRLAGMSSFSIPDEPIGQAGVPDEDLPPGFG
jgi:hypothetical protein